MIIVNSCIPNDTVFYSLKVFYCIGEEAFSRIKHGGFMKPIKLSLSLFAISFLLTSYAQAEGKVSPHNTSSVVGSRGNEGNYGQSVSSSGTVSVSGSGTVVPSHPATVSPGSRGNEGGARVCPEIGIVCKAGTRPVMDKNCKQSCVTVPTANPPATEPGTVGGNTPPPFTAPGSRGNEGRNPPVFIPPGSRGNEGGKCPMIAIVCKPGEKSVMDDKCKQSCVPDNAKKPDTNSTTGTGSAI